MQVNDYLQNLQLQDPLATYPARRVTRRKSLKTLGAQGVEQSFIADKTIVSFAAGMSPQYRSDVLNSTLLAQLAANKKFDNGREDTLKWYSEFIDVLSHLGWVIEAADFNTYEAKGSILKVENVVIDILVSAFGNSFLGVITKTLNALKSPKENKKLIAFETNISSVQKGCFQLAAAVESNNTVVMKVGTFLLTSSSKVKQILFFEFGKDSTKLEYINRSATFNAETYAPHREVVAEMLSDKVGKFIAEIDI